MTPPTDATSWSVVLGLVAGGANALGGFFIVRSEWARGYVKHFLALGAGFMLGTVALEMIPESFQMAGSSAGMWLLVGYLLMHFFEHSLQAHFHFGEEVHESEMSAHTGYTILGGLIAHCFFDGIAIAAGFLVSHWLGFTVFLAVFLHKIPEGFTVASVMMASGRGVRVAMFSAGMLAVATLAGVLTMVVFRTTLPYALPVAAGVTTYVAASDLIPEVNREPGIKMAFVVFAGVAMLLALEYVFHR